MTDIDKLHVVVVVHHHLVHRCHERRGLYRVLLMCVECVGGRATCGRSCTRVGHRLWLCFMLLELRELHPFGRFVSHYPAHVVILFVPDMRLTSCSCSSIEFCLLQSTQFTIYMVCNPTRVQSASTRQYSHSDSDLTCALSTAASFCSALLHKHWSAFHGPCSTDYSRSDFSQQCLESGIYARSRRCRGGTGTGRLVS